jgi:RHS repeat-associated protein
MLQPGRQFNADRYRFGYQGSEKDDEIAGTGNMYTTYFRQLDVRIGRWWSYDPKPNASLSPYASMGCNPILYNDPFGDTLRAGDKKSQQFMKSDIKSTFQDKSDRFSFSEKGDVSYSGTKDDLTEDQLTLLNQMETLINSSTVTNVEYIEGSTYEYTNKKGKKKTIDILKEYGGGVTIHKSETESKENYIVLTEVSPKSVTRLLARGEDVLANLQKGLGANITIKTTRDITFWHEITEASIGKVDDRSVVTEVENAARRAHTYSIDVIKNDDGTYSFKIGKKESLPETPPTVGHWKNKTR